MLMAFDDPQFGNEFDTDFGVKLLDGAQPNSVTRELQEKGFYQKSYGFMLEAFAGSLEGKTVVDVNANIGYWTLMLSKLVGSEGTVISIEPAQWNFGVLTENIRRCGWANNVIPLRNALVHETPEGKIPLYHNIYDASGHSLHPIREGDDDDFEQVRGLTLDDIIDNKDNPYLINVNIQDPIDREIAWKGIRNVAKKYNTKIILKEGRINIVEEARQ